MEQVQPLVSSSRDLALRRTIAVMLGTALVSLAAQVAVPIPGTPVPVTLQPLAVLIVGGLLGPALGASSLVLYLLLGAAGLPVFTPFGLPGVARLIGPTGGYLLAFAWRVIGGGCACRSPRCPASSLSTSADSPSSCCSRARVRRRCSSARSHSC